MQNFIKTIVSALQAWTKKELAKMKPVQADWSQNDPNADSYIKNRTHWVEDTRNTFYVEEITVGNFAADYYNGIYKAGLWDSPLNIKEQLEIGKQYTVMWDGVEYLAEFCETDGGRYFGHDYYISSWETDLPFGIWVTLDNTIDVVTANSNESSHTFAIYEGSYEIHRLDPKYLDLPTNLATIDDVIHKMDKNNPSGIGSFSMNRIPESYVGENSVAIGKDVISSGKGSVAIGSGAVATHQNQIVQGRYNIFNIAFISERSANPSYDIPYNHAYLVSEEYSFSELSGLYSLINPKIVQIGSTGLKGYYLMKLEDSNEGSSEIMYELTGPYTTSTYEREVYTYTVKKIEDKNAYVVGNGASDTERSNAHTLDWDGNAWYQGDVYVGGTSQDDEAAKKLVTDEFVENLVQDFIEAPKNYITLKDEKNQYDYIIKMSNGNLISMCKCAKIEVVEMPTKTEYIDGEPFDPTGMIVTAICQDGSRREISGCTYDSIVTSNNGSIFEINYTEYNTVYTTIITLTVIDTTAALSDFGYITNADGTYTLTEWKGTANGVVSTECIIPNNAKIKL